MTSPSRRGVARVLPSPDAAAEVNGSSETALEVIESLPPSEREGIAIGYIPLEAVRSDMGALCPVTETHRLTMPPANWGSVKVGAGTPPVRVDEGWLSVIHGVDELAHPRGTELLRYCAGVHHSRRCSTWTGSSFDRPIRSSFPNGPARCTERSVTSCSRPASIIAASASSTSIMGWPTTRSAGAE